jgi:methylmalonyl-CoA mutase C-terminal domain/subunit
MTLFTDVSELLKKKGVDDVLLIGGGIVPEDDVERLKKTGMSEIFGPGASTDEIVQYISQRMKK